jgi:hypothetical protein
MFVNFQEEKEESVEFETWDMVVQSNQAVCSYAPQIKPDEQSEDVCNN